MLLADHERVASPVCDAAKGDAALYLGEFGIRVGKRKGQDLGIVPVPDEDAVGIGAIVVEPVAFASGVVRAAPGGEWVCRPGTRAVIGCAHHRSPATGAKVYTDRRPGLDRGSVVPHRAAVPRLVHVALFHERHQEHGPSAEVVCGP